MSVVPSLRLSMHCPVPKNNDMCLIRKDVLQAAVDEIERLREDVVYLKNMWTARCGISTTQGNKNASVS